MWNTTYVLVCVAHFCAYATRIVLDPVWPLYLVGLGHSPTVVGITLAVFSATAFLIRPFIGHAVDRWSPRGVNMLGGVAGAVAAFAYLAPSMIVLLGARVVHGLGWASFNTAGAVIAAEATPPKRRGEAMGYLNMMPSLGFVVLPALGLWIMGAVGLPWVFVAAGVGGLLSLCASAMIRERPRVRAGGREGAFWGNLIETRVALPALLLMLINVAHPINTIYVVLYAQERGIGDLALYFVVIGLGSVAGGFLSRLSDRWGRRRVCAASFVSGAVGLATMMSATSFWPMAIGGMLGALGTGLANGVLMAFALDLTPANRRGAAMATYTAAFQIGVGTGGLLWGVAIDWWGFQQMFLGAIALLLLGLAVLGADARGRGPGVGGRGSVLPDHN